MGFYSRLIFPRLCELALNQPFVAEQRRQLLSAARGEVLEIGFGTGLNLPHYPPAVRKLTVVDPNGGMYSLAKQRIKQSPVEVERHLLSGERLPFADATFDCVVSTFTLCSVVEVDQALGEAFRVLRPGGQFLFLEHGLSPDPQVQLWQRRLNWLQMCLGGGCHLDRNVRQLVAAQPFLSLDSSEFYLEKGPKTHSYTYRGSATK